MNLFQRLFLFFLIAIFIPLFISSLIIYMRAAHSIQKQVGEYLHKNILVTNLQVDRFLEGYEQVTLPLVTDPNVKEFVELGANQELKRYQVYSDIVDKMNQITEQNDAIDLMYIITAEGRSILSEDRYYSPLDPFPIEKVYQELSEIAPDSGKVVFKARKTMDGKIVITFTRKIRGTDFEPRGILGVDLTLSSIEEFWSMANLGERSNLMILDDEGQIIYHPDSNLFGSYVRSKTQTAMSQERSGSFISTWEEEQKFYYYQTANSTNWKTVTTIPKRELYEPISGIRIVAFTSGGLSLLLASLLAFGFTRSIVKPIHLLQQHLRKMEKGIWSKVPKLDGPAEIVSLVKSYNRMIEELKKLIDKIYHAELQNQKTQLKVQEREIEMQKNELQALQSQINPHFLYNTLETMNAYGLIKGSDEISEIADSLASMFRYSVKNLEVVTLADELDHIRSYLVIQEHRMRKNFTLKICVHPNYFDKEIVKLSLQPLVENAIEHGLKDGEALGEIKIAATMKDELFLVSVEDNGQGMSLARLHEMRRFLQTVDKESQMDGAAGIGLKNIHRRIQLLFGDKYGLQLESELGKGTRVIIKVPSNLRVEGS
ncbi:cache domain-containing sensor histidine kinase [Gracilibacillus phocaeensis]|uniref:cache domain-containing sensor histidine kinase n=1 Tax=Gracilibacillus phocaeensis TaxID=2042304 RepID=UPI0013EF30F5|nr:histidine kinase [Gracilibacillus phocaeensis]